MPSELLQLHAVVRGKVQGVFFRDFVLSHARRLGVKGVVANLPDGTSLETTAEGEKGALEELLRLLQQGPPQARVDQVESRWGPSTDKYRDFRIAFS